MKTLQESHTISCSDKRLLEEIRDIVHGFLPTATVLLYGSVARGGHGPDSDYDILVLSDEPLSTEEKEEIWGAIYGLQLERDVVISTVFYAKDEWDTPLRRVSPFHEEVEKDAVIL